MDDVYLETIERFEPEIAHIDTSAWGTSLAVSTKRIADQLETLNNNLSTIREILTAIEMSVR